MSNILTDFNASLKKLKTFNKQIVGNRQNIDKFQREVSEGLHEINEKVNILKGLIKKLQDEIQTSKQNITSNTSLISQKDANVDNNTRIILRLRQEVTSLTKEVSDLTEENDKKQHDLNRLRETAFESPDNLAELNAYKVKFQEMMDSNEIEQKQLNAKIKAIQNSKDDEESAKKKALDLIKQYQQRLKSNKEENDSLKDQIKTLTAELAALQKGKTEDVKKLEKERIDQQQKHEELLTKQLETRQEEIKSLNERSSTVELAIKKLTLENSRLTQENIDLKKENKDLNDTIANATRIINASTENINQLSKIDMQSAGPRIAEINQTLTEMIQSLDSSYMPPPRSSFSPFLPNTNDTLANDDNDDNDLNPTKSFSDRSMMSQEEKKDLFDPKKPETAFNDSLKEEPFKYGLFNNQYGITGVNRKPSRTNPDQVNPFARNLNFKQKEKSLFSPNVVDSNGFSFDEKFFDKHDDSSLPSSTTLELPPDLGPTSKIPIPKLLPSNLGLTSNSLPNSNARNNIENFGKPSPLNQRIFKSKQPVEKISPQEQYPTSASLPLSSFEEGSLPPDTKTINSPSLSASSLQQIQPRSQYPESTSKETLSNDLLGSIKKDIMESTDKENGMTEIYNKYAVTGKKTQIENYINTIKRLNKPEFNNVVRRSDYERYDGGKNKTKKIHKTKKINKTKKVKKMKKSKTQKGGFIYDSNTKRKRLSSNSNSSRSNSNSSRSNRSQRRQNKRIRHRSSD
jgi:hypothetical protein